MREIKFRGKAVNPEELDDLDIPHEIGWVYGNLITNNGRLYIVGNVVESCDEYIALEYWVRVDPKTVGQYTGEDDDKGKEIYDGDIFRDSDGGLWHVFYEDGGYLAKGGDFNLVESLIEFVPDHCTIIGNIHDNPEMLGE